MITDFEELKLAEIDTFEEVQKLIEEKLEMKLSSCAESLELALKEKAETVIGDVINLAPYGDYDKLIEEPDAILSFLKHEASKQDNWKLSRVEYKKKEDRVIELTFDNKAVDEGDSLRGFVFVGISGKIRHAFVKAYN